MKSNLFETLKNAQNESLVQEAYNEEFKKALKVVSTRPYECDALYVANQGGETVKFIVEYKLDRELSTPIKRAEVLIQVLFYLKRFEQAGELLPSVVVVADRNECFVMHSNVLIKYLDEDIDWKVAPSNAYMKYGELVRKIASEDANPYIFDINENFDFSDVIEDTQRRNSGEFWTPTVWADEAQRVITE